MRLSVAATKLDPILKAAPSVGLFVCWSRHVLGRTPVVTYKKKIFVSKKLQYSKMFVILGEH